jgi:hypothetical protein
MPSDFAWGAKTVLGNAVRCSAERTTLTQFFHIFQRSQEAFSRLPLIWL